MCNLEWLVDQGITSLSWNVNSLCVFSFLLLLQRQVGGMRWATAVPYSRGQLEPVWRVCGMSCLRWTRLLHTGTGMLVPNPAQSPTCYRTSAWPRLHHPSQLHLPASASAGPCLALTSLVVAALPGALRDLECGRQWKREGATVGAASNVALSGTCSSGSQPCSVAPASAYRPAPTPWSCPLSPSVLLVPQPSRVWHPSLPHPSPCLLNPQRSHSTSLTNRSATLSPTGPLPQALLIPLQSLNVVVDRGVFPAVAHSRVSSMTRRLEWSVEDQPTLTNRGLLWIWQRWPR